MKKIVLITALACAISGTAFAESMVDYKTDTVTISGNADGRVGITVFCPDMWFEDITEDVFSNDVVSHNMQTTASADGVYSFSFKQKDETGLYRYSTSTQRGKREEGTFVYVSVSDREEIVDALNSATEDEIAEICGTYQFELEIDDSVFQKADSATTSKILASYISESPFSADDFRTVSDVVKTAYAAGVITSGEVKSLNEIKDVYSFIDGRIYEWMSSKKITDLRKKEIIADLKGSYTSFEDLSDKFIEKLVLCVVEQPNGMNNLKAVISDFEEEIDVDASKLKSKDYDRVSGEHYASLLKLKKALTETQSGGNGGSGKDDETGATKPSGNNSVPSVVIADPTPNTYTGPDTYIMKFEDIDSVSWAYESIAALARDGVVSGKSETVFDPMGNLTREEFVTMLVGVLKLETSGYTGEYNDVSADAWYSKYVDAATKNNLCNGVGNNNFGVGMPITRQDMCVMIYNAIKDEIQLEIGENAFVDGNKIADYAKNAVSSLANINLVNGNDKKEVLPTNKTTRAEAAVLLNSLRNYMQGGNN